MIHTRHNFACESSTFCRNYFTRMTLSYRKLIWWRLFDCFRYGVKPTTRETHAYEPRRTRRKDRPVWILPTFAAMPQVQTTHARAVLCEINMAKYLRKLTNSFLCTTNFCPSRAELQCEEVASLEELVSLLLKSGKDNFVHTTANLGTDDDIIFAHIHM